MKGLELSETFYRLYGKPMIEREFSDYEHRIAAGLVGWGSECFGFDDELSRDHDFEPRFFLWVSGETEREIGFRLMRAYDKLPKEFMGVTKRESGLYGGGRSGVTVIGDFYERLIGRGNAEMSLTEWLYLPDYALAQATNGKVFRDDEGVFTEIREALKTRPEDVRKKKIAARAAMMAQSGQYNYPRALKRGETAAAHLLSADFVKNALYLLYLLNGRYAPHDKWLFRGLEGIGVLAEIPPKLEFLLRAGEDRAMEKIDTTEEICADFAKNLRESGLSDATGDFLEPHALSVSEKIRSAELRFLHIMEG